MIELPLKVYAVAYAAALVVFVAVDFVWLSAMADRLYRPVLGDMLAPQFRLAPAVAFYLIFAAGLTFLAVKPGLEQGSIRVAVVHAAVLGFVAYATYDLTNHATLKSWSTQMTVADMIWGSLLSAIAGGASCWIADRAVGS